MLTSQPLDASQRLLLARAVEAFQEDLDASDEARQYLAGRGFNHDTNIKYRLGFVGRDLPGLEDFRGRIAIPSIADHDRVVAIRFRAITDIEPKILGQSGTTTRLFNARAIVGTNDIIGITEGEFDAISIELLGLPCTGVTGASNWKRHYPRMFTGFRKVLIFGDGDKAGQAFANKVYESLASDTIAIRMPLPSGEDPNSMYQDVKKRAALAALIEENSR